MDLCQGFLDLCHSSYKKKTSSWIKLIDRCVESSSTRIYVKVWIDCGLISVVSRLLGFLDLWHSLYKEDNAPALAF